MAKPPQEIVRLQSIFLRNAFYNRRILPRPKNIPPVCFLNGLSNPYIHQSKSPPARGGLLLWRREWDSNPRYLSVSPVFKTGSLNRSDISPCVLNDIISDFKSQGVFRQKTFLHLTKPGGYARILWQSIEQILLFGVIPKRPKGLPC